MRILYLDPFHGGSHAAVANGYAQHSRHQIDLLTLPIAGGWRWRMRGAAVTFARMLRERATTPYDLIITTDMLDLATFLGLSRDITANTPTVVYFHENQLTYPLPAGRTRDLAFPWINYTSALAATAVCFNSDFHRRVFLDALPGLIGRYHDYQELAMIDAIAAKSHVLPPGVDLSGLTPSDPPSEPDGPPILLWNSRWEYDKNPTAFFAALEELEARGVDFRLIVLGEHVDPKEASFAAARERFGGRALAWGYAPDVASYRARLRQADIVVSTAIQEFFGISVIEAIACGCVPILPRRLSYPEIIPPAFHADCLYEHDGALADKLQEAIGNLPALKRRGLHTLASRYDWRQLAATYDAMFETVIATANTKSK